MQACGQRSKFKVQGPEKNAAEPLDTDIGIGIEEDE
jgi:hypothetical protein